MQTFDAALAMKKRTEGIPCQIQASKDGREAVVQRRFTGFVYRVPGQGNLYAHDQDEASMRAKLAQAGFSPNEAIWE